MIVKRDPEDRRMIHVDHDEATGEFILKRPTFAAKLELERVKGAMIGPFPTPDGEVTAEYCSLVQVGFEKTPDGFDVKKLTSEKLLLGLYKEVAEYWASFREKEQD